MAEEKENQAAESAPENAPVEVAQSEQSAATESVAEQAPEATAVEEETEQRSAATEEAPAADAAPAVRRRGRGRHIPVGIAHIKATFNNTQVSISDPSGGVVSWSSAGRAGFKGSRKSTAFAATLVAQEAARAAVAKGMHEVEVRVQGAGAGRESAIRGIQSAGMSVTMIKDVTPIAHNGCRARKRRRV
jgi:small subunit ribosomal protein S11